jgi:beta-mannosidase
MMSQAQEQALAPDLPQATGLDWVEVSLPNSVQGALFAAGKIPDPYYARNADSCKWMEKGVWLFKRRFRVDKAWQGRQVWLDFGAVDYICSVFLNGKLLGAHEGAEGGPTFEISRLVDFGGENELQVAIAPTQPQDDTALVRGESLGDWWPYHPGLNPRGIWRSVRLYATGPVKIDFVAVGTQKIGAASAEVQFRVGVAGSGSPAGLELEGTVRRPDGAVVDHWRSSISGERGRVEVNRRIDKPQLWWPNGMGGQPLYRIDLTLFSGDEVSDRLVRTFGIRTLTCTEDLQFVINGVPLFVKGVDWTPMDVLLRNPAGKYEWLLTMAKSTHVDMIRVWGGGHIEDDFFYDCCDRLGILVWQELLMNCGYECKFPSTLYLPQVERNVKRLGAHPSLAMWCGGNEFNPRLPANLPLLQAAQEIIGNIQGPVPFYLASPDLHDTHVYGSGIREQERTIVTQFGGVNMATEYAYRTVHPLKSLRRIIPEDEIRDLQEHFSYDKINTTGDGPQIHSHLLNNPYCFNYHMSQPSDMLIWMSQEFGLARSLEDFVRYSQAAQSAWLMELTDFWRANWPSSKGSMPWVLNTPVASSSFDEVVDYWGVPTMGFYGVQEAYAPVRISAQLPRLAWRSGETLIADVRVLTDLVQPPRGCRARVTLFGPKLNVIRQQEEAVTFGRRMTSATVMRFAYPIGREDENAPMLLVASLYAANGELVSRASYWPKAVRQVRDDEWFAKYIAHQQRMDYTRGPWVSELATVPTTLDLQVTRGQATGPRTASFVCTVRNTGRVPALYTSIEATNPDADVVCERNYFVLLPGEAQVVSVTVLTGPSPFLNGAPVINADRLAFRAAAWNAPASVGSGF